MRYPFDGTFEQTQDWNDPRYRSSYFQFNLLGHNGEDYACPAWTPILAPHNGVIREATFDSGYGNYVKVENTEETSVLAHLSKISASEGGLVLEGDLIGYSGNTGNSTGAHLHWGYYRTQTRDRDNGFLGYIDQTDWLDREIIAQPIAQSFTDQTKIPAVLLNSADFKVVDDTEIQALRGFLGDLGRAKNQIISLETEIDVLDSRIAAITEELKECVSKPPEAPKNVSYSWSGLLDYLGHLLNSG